MKRNSARKRKIIFGIIALGIAGCIMLTSGQPFNGVPLELCYAFSLLGVALLFAGILIP